MFLKREVGSKQRTRVTNSLHFKSSTGKHPFVGSDRVLVILVNTARCGYETGLTDSPPTRCVSDNAHYTISLEFSAGHSKKCTNTVSIQIAAKNLVCPGLPVESEERCVCVWQLNVDGCIWIRRGGREWGGGREYERSRQEKEARVGWVIRQIQIDVVV